MKAKRLHIIINISFLFLFIRMSQALSYSADKDPKANSNGIETYIVHVERPNHSKNLQVIDLEKWYTSFLPNTTLDTGEPRMIYCYRDAISGFAARLTANEVLSMQKLGGYLHAWHDERLPLAITYTPSFLGLSKWDGLWFDSLYGEGMVIGVLDTGIASSHPSFDGESMLPPPATWKVHCRSGNQTICSNKVINGVSFNRGRKPLYKSDAKTGHGTHVAAIAAGNFISNADVLGNARGPASGMAPKAHLAIYKVCSKDGCIVSDVLSGIDEAISDGVDVLCIAIARDHPALLYDDAIAVGSLAAVRKGIITCLPAGNTGPYKSIIFNDAPWILTVGASSIDRRISVIIRLGNGVELVGQSAYQTDIRNFTMSPLVFPGYKGHGIRHVCKPSSFDGINVVGNIVLCVSTGLKNIQTSNLIQSAGGSALILLNPFEMGSTTSTTTAAEVHPLPVAHVSYSDALSILSYIESTSTPTAAILFNGTQFGARPSPAVASFSSRGPSLINGGILKPDIVAPGVNILSAWKNPSDGQAYNFLSGTSMAAAHISGIVALHKSIHRHWSPAAIKSAIMTTADIVDKDNIPIVDEYDNKISSLFSMGAGQVNPSLALNPGLIYDIQQFHYTHYLCGLGYSDQQVSIMALRLIRCSNTPNINAEQLNYPSISATIGATLKKNITRHVTNVGEARSVYVVRIEEPKGVRINLSTSRLRFYKRYQKKSFQIELRTKGVPLREGEVSEGQLFWISDKYTVRSPLSITFT